MGNCLVTKLKGSVSDNNLITLDELKFGVFQDSVFAVYYIPGTFTIRSGNGATFNVSIAGTSVATGVASYTGTTAGDQNISVTNLSKDANLIISKTGVRRIRSTKITYDLYSIGYIDTVLELNINNEALDDIITINNMPINVGTVYLYGNCVGDFKPLGRCTSLTKLHISHITDDLINLVKYQIANSRESATITGPNWTSFKFNGNPISTNVNNNTLTWSKSGSQYNVSFTNGTESYTATLDENGNIIS